MTDKEAIKELTEIKLIYCGTKDEALDLAIKALEERPQGEWIEVDDNQPYSKDKLYGCSKCRFGCYLLSDTKNVNFCPKCGVSMKKGGAEE
jgi:PHP family Zn ribbon phosphoesterase